MQTGKQMSMLNERELIQESLTDFDEERIEREREKEAQRVLQSFREFARNLTK